MSPVTPQRRQRGENTVIDGSPWAGSPSQHGSRSSKRARLDPQTDTPRSQRPLQSRVHTLQTDGDSKTRRTRDGGAPVGHQPGAIVRVKLENFVTYTAAEFFPGPSLNMVIGPNGTGKSTLVCAICLGLGWGPQHLGRAKEVSEFVKHGSPEAMIEIELAKDPARHKHNLVFRCNIKRDGNKTSFSVNGKPSNKKAVVELAKSFSIQIDNLCQFLPQDKVVEFAAMTPIELLRSTQRAVASQEMIGWHEDLKLLRSNQRSVQNQDSADREVLASLEARQRMQEADVARYREREQIKERVARLEIAKEFAESREVIEKSNVAKVQLEEARAELKALEDQVEPSLRTAKTKQLYRDQIKLVARERKQNTEKTDRAASNSVEKFKTLDAQIKELEAEIDAEDKGKGKVKIEVARLNGNITKLKKQMEEQPIELDAAAYNEQMRAKKRAMDDYTDQATQVIKDQQDLDRQGVERKRRIVQAEKDLESLESQAGQQNNKLWKMSRDTAKAWDWIQAHQNEFEKQVYGPPIVECSVKDLKYVSLVENSFGLNDFTTFTVQTRADFKKLHHQLHQQMGLLQITIRTMTGNLGNFNAPVSKEELCRYGLDGWVLDYITGPEPVLAMLCSEGPRLHQTAVALNNITSEQYDVLANSPISTWVTSKSVYRVSRRREYGPSAVSTSVRDVKPARMWTSQPVDMGVKRELQRNIAEWNEELLGFRARFEELDAQRKDYGRQQETVAEELQLIGEEKAAKQKALSEYRALPIRLRTEENKLAEKQAAADGSNQRKQAINDKIDSVTLKKAQAALGYGSSVEELQKAYSAYHEAEIMLIEANSDCEVLSERNSAAQLQVTTHRQKVDENLKEFQAMRANCKRVVLRTRERMRTMDDELRAFLEDYRTQTTTEIEAEMESETAQLELLHEGDYGIIRDFEDRQMKIERLTARLVEIENATAEFHAKIQAVRTLWEPKLEKLIKRISASFSYNMQQMGCAGEVGIHKDEDDFDQWAIEIRVKFREHEPLTLLDSHRQSGGERAVSTIFYLMSLQSLTRSPFRVVDEINQGMDPRNERLVHARMVSIATGHDEQQFHLPDRVRDGKGEGDKGGEGEERAAGSQYFLITPKLLHGLTYERGMRILCIASGEYMPADAGVVDFGACVERRRGVAAAAG